MSPGLSESETRSVEEEQVGRTEDEPVRTEKNASQEKQEESRVHTEETRTENKEQEEHNLVENQPKVVVEEENSEKGSVPNGYEAKTDPVTGESYYVNIFTGNHM